MSGTAAAGVSIGAAGAAGAVASGVPEFGAEFAAAGAEFCAGGAEFCAAGAEFCAGAATCCGGATGGAVGFGSKRTEIFDLLSPCGSAVESNLRMSFPALTPEGNASSGEALLKASMAAVSAA